MTLDSYLQGEIFPFFRTGKQEKEREESDSLDLICELVISSYQCKREELVIEEVVWDGVHW